jgi:hypothetical protein
VPDYKLIISKPKKLGRVPTLALTVVIKASRPSAMARISVAPSAITPGMSGMVNKSPPPSAASMGLTTWLYASKGKAGFTLAMVLRVLTVMT